MVENGVITITLDLMGHLGPNIERKVLVKILCFIAEDGESNYYFVLINIVWYRSEIINYLNNKYPTSNELENWKNKILDDPLDINEREFFLDILKFTDLSLGITYKSENLTLLEAYKPGKAFYESTEFPICKVLEENYELIRNEVLRLQNDNLVN